MGDYNYHIANANYAHLAWTDGRVLQPMSPTPTPPGAATPVPQPDIRYDKVKLDVGIPRYLLPSLAWQAQTLPGSGWWSSQVIQNTGPVTAVVSSLTYDASNATNISMAAKVGLASNLSVSFLPRDSLFMDRLSQGSAVIYGDQPIRAIANLTNRYTLDFGSLYYGVSGGVAGGQYQGADTAFVRTELSFPLVKRSFGSPLKSTTFFVQNAGSAAATVTATYVGCGTHTNNSTSISPGQMVVMKPADAGVPTGSLCTAKMTSTQPIAGVAAEHYDSENPATLLQTTRGFSSAEYDTKLYAPIFKKRFPNVANMSRTTGAQVQNVSAGTISITATYYGNCTGLPWSETRTGVAQGGWANFLYPSGMPDGCLATAKFEGTGAIVGIVNESYLDPAPGPGTQSATAYNMIPITSVTAKVFAPLYKEQLSGKTSGMQVMNVGTSNATIYVVFRSGTNTWTTANYIVAPNQSANFYLMANCGLTCWGANPPMPAGTNASATVYSNQPIVAVVAEQPYPDCFGQGGGACYDRQNYEGFNVAP
jgi:hypothetical protein